MKKKLFNIHKLIGINILLFFFISLFFGILTIFQPYINLWEDKKKHISNIAFEDINLNQCIKQINKRTYFGEDGKKIRNDFIKMTFPALEVRSTNLMIVKNRANFHLDPNTCKRVRSKTFTISKFFDRIHTGAIFNSLIFKIIFGFMSVAVVFLCLSGLILILKNSYRNSKTKTVKGFFAKYHRLLSLYTLPLILMFGITGALFNLGVYSSPLITSYLTKGETANVLKVKRNILVDPDLALVERSKDVKTMDLNKLFKKAVKEFDDIKFYEMQVYNLNDINAKVKFIGYEPKNFFISSMTNETYLVLNGVTGEVIDKKMAKEGTFTEKTLDSIFYLHYLRTFSDIPRIIFGIICLFILFGLIYAMFLWLFRAKKDKFTYKILKPFSFTILLGSLVSSAALFLSAWIIPKKYMHFNFLNSLLNTQELIFYFVFILIFIFILIKKDIFLVTKNSFLLVAILLILSVLAHQIFSGFNFIQLFKNDLYIIAFVDIILLSFALFFILLYFKLPKKYFELNHK